MSTNFWYGDKVNLRAVELKDTEILFKESNQNIEIQRNLDEIWFPISMEYQKEFVINKSKKYAENDEFFFIIENKNGDCIGTINSHHCDKRIGKFQYGISIWEKYQRKGNAKEAILLLLRYFFKELRYQKVTVFICDFNEKSIELHKKIGFQKEGQIRRVVYTDGKYFDHIVYGMTKEEFNEID